MYVAQSGGSTLNSGKDNRRGCRSILGIVSRGAERGRIGKVWGERVGKEEETRARRKREEERLWLLVLLGARRKMPGGTK